KLLTFPLNDMEQTEILARLPIRVRNFLLLKGVVRLLPRPLQVLVIPRHMLRSLSSSSPLLFTPHQPPHCDEPNGDHLNHPSHLNYPNHPNHPSHLNYPSHPNYPSHLDHLDHLDHLNHPNHPNHHSHRHLITTIRDGARQLTRHVCSLVLRTMIQIPFPTKQTVHKWSFIAICTLLFQWRVTRSFPPRRGTHLLAWICATAALASIQSRHS